MFYNNNLCRKEFALRTKKWSLEQRLAWRLGDSVEHRAGIIVRPQRGSWCACAQCTVSTRIAETGPAPKQTGLIKKKKIKRNCTHTHTHPSHSANHHTQTVHSTVTVLFVTDSCILLFNECVCARTGKGLTYFATVFVVCSLGREKASLLFSPSIRIRWMSVFVAGDRTITVRSNAHPVHNVWMCAVLHISKFLCF